MRLLLTNDDGVDAAGLHALAQYCVGKGYETTVVAPLDGCSSCGHRVTTDRPIKYGQRSNGYYWVDGSPADCVRVALMHLQIPVDWVLSGINQGGNLGVDIWMSGTVAAAREATLLGRKSIALSQYRCPGVTLDWETSAIRAGHAIDNILDQDLPTSHFWNVNLPALNRDADMPSIAYCLPESQALTFSFESVDDGVIYRSVYQTRPHIEGTDVNLCFAGNITASRLTVGW